MLLSEGLTFGHIYVLAEGRIEVVRGKTQVAVVSDPGSVFGEMSVLLYTETYRGAEYNVSFVSKVKIELAIERSTLDRVIEAIRTAGLSGQIGDGKIFIQDIERAMRIRTGETGQAAL